MKKELIKIIKKAGKILKKGYYSNKDVTFKAKKDLVNYILNFKDTNKLFKELSEEEKNAFINEISLLKYFKV